MTPRATTLPPAPENPRDTVSDLPPAGCRETWLPPEMDVWVDEDDSEEGT
jgi:hypothetical protein